MKKIGIFLLMFLTFLMASDYEGRTEYTNAKTHDWLTADEDRDKGNYLRGQAYKYANRIKQVIQNKTRYSRNGNGYGKAEVHTELMNEGQEWQVRSWIQVTAARNLIDVPSKDLLNGKHREYTTVTHKTKTGYADAVVSFKPGIASVQKENPFCPWSKTIKRPFEHTVYVAGYFSKEGSPTGLPDLNPYVLADVDIKSRSRLGLQPPIPYASFTTPICEGSDGEHPIPLLMDKCPGAPGVDYTSP